MSQNYWIWSLLLWITALHLLGMELISRRRRSLSTWISLHTLTISCFSWVMFSHFNKRLDHTKQCPKFLDVWPIENVWGIVKERVAKKKCENISWSTRLSKCGGKSMLTRTFFVGWWNQSPRGASCNPEQGGPDPIILRHIYCNQESIWVL